jgi:hypothetical protein
MDKGKSSGLEVEPRLTAEKLAYYEMSHRASYMDCLESLRNGK